MITVVNKKTHVPTDHDFYIGRGSPLGNPLPISPTVTREQAIDYYKTYLKTKLNDTASQRGEAIRKEMNRIWRAAKTGDINLVCFCKPNDCHGDFIKKLIEEKL